MDPLGPVVLPFVPEHIMEMYSENMVLRTYRKLPANLTYRARCARCREVGVLWVDLKFYWFEFIKNCLCTKCYTEMPEDEKYVRWLEGQIWRLRMRERRLARRAHGIKRKAP